MRHRILSMLCEAATLDAERRHVPQERQVNALKAMFGEVDLGHDTDVSEVMTVANFPALFSHILSRKVREHYASLRSNWRAFTYPDTTPDFRDVRRYQFSRPGTLFQRGEQQETEMQGLSHTSQDYGVAEFARGFELSWHVLVNDDLGFLKRFIGGMTQAALLFEDEFVTALYDNATVQAAMIALGAGYSGSGRLSYANLAVGVTAMRTRRDAENRPIAIQGVWLVIPPELELTAIKILSGTAEPDTASNNVNVVRRFIRGYYVDPNIVSAPPNSPWYLIAEPSDVMPTITVARLEGWGDTPKLWMKAPDRLPMTDAGSLGAPDVWSGSFRNKTIEIEVEDIIGGWDDTTWVGVTDYHGLYYSSGTV
jgi:hypothetical protein